MNTPSTFSFTLFIYFAVDLLQRGFRIFVSRCSSSRGNESGDARGRQALPIERSGCKRGNGWIAAETHRMWSGAIFPNARHPNDRPRWQQHAKARQHLSRNGQKYFRQIEIQFCWIIFLFFVCDKWVDSTTKNSEIPENRRAGATTTTGKLKTQTKC